ncbi:MAG TPA: DUF3035 domain-containing protein [Caulobacterales bacterium]|nr:DUF3035 domain-containing protein [Caulobacterales bacterium]
MTNKTAVIAVLAAVAATGGCSHVKQALGATKVAPDEFRVVTQAPLTLPPDYSLRPPRPGEPRPTELAPDAEAHAALFTQDVGQTASPGEAALVRSAGAEAVDPNVREQVDFEGQSIVHKDQSFADRILGFHSTPATPENTSTPLDPQAEQQRLAEQEAVRRATGGGQVVIERSARSGFKLPGT